VPDIFLSYNREDQAAARRFAEAFKAQGLDVWWDSALRSGETYDQVTEKALREAKAVVVLWSKKSVQSNWVRAEASIGQEHKHLAPVKIEACDLPVMFRLVQTAELSHWKGEAKDPAWLAFLSDVRRLVESDGLAPSSETRPAQPPPVVRPAQKPLLKRPAMLGGIAAAGVALIAAVAMFAMGPQTGQTTTSANERTAFFGFTAASSDPLASEIATNATEETYTALRILQIESAARGQTQGVALTGQLDKAAALGARYALGGDVRASGDEITVNVRLDDVGTLTTLWEQTLTGAPTERESLPVLAAGLASTVLQCLISVRPDMVREDASALALVTRACQFSDNTDRQYVALWRDAEQVAPNSFFVQRRIAGGWINQSTSASDAERPAMLQEARAAAERMLVLKPTSQDARVRLAQIDIASDRPIADIVAAINAAFEAADASGDRSGMDSIAERRMLAFSMVGRHADSARLGRSDATAYPFGATVQATYGRTLWYAGQNLEARTVFDAVIRRFAHENSWSNRAAMAIADGEDIAPILAAAPPAVSVETVACYKDVARAARATDAGVRAAGASRLLGCVRAGNITPRHAIGTLNLLGQVDAAYTVAGPLVKRSNPQGFLVTGGYMFAPMTRPMRVDPRFLPLMRETGIYQYWLDTRTQPDVCETPEEREFEVCVALRKDQGK
jgi:TolB-like protein